MSSPEALAKGLTAYVDDVEVTTYPDDTNLRDKVTFHIDSGLIEPEVSQVLADHDATLFGGCLDSGYHEFQAWV